MTLSKRILVYRLKIKILHVFLMCLGVAVGLFRFFKVCSDGKERVGAESSGKLPHLFIPSKTATLVPEFAVEDLLLDRTATLVLALQ